MKTKHGSNLRIETVRDLQDLEPYREAWDRLAAQSHQCLPDLSWAWVASFFEHRMQPGETWMCLLAMDENRRLAGLLPLISRPHPFLRGQRLLRTPSDAHTQSVDFLIERGCETEVIHGCFAALSREVPAWFSLTLSRLPALSPTLGLKHRRPAGLRLLDRFDGWASVIPTQGTWEDYRAGSDPKLHRTLHKSSARLDRLPGVRTRTVCGPAAAGSQYFDDFLALEASGWKGRNGTAILNSPAETRFYRALTQRLAASGWLEWHFLEADGKIVSAMLTARLNHALVLYKTAYDEACADCAPGLVLRMKIIEDAFKAGGTREINFISDMPDHQKWNMQKRGHRTLTFFPCRPVPWLFGFLPMRLKLLFKSVPGLAASVRRMQNLLRRTPTRV